MQIFKKGDMIKCNTKGYTNLTDGFIYEVVEPRPSNVLIKNDIGRTDHYPSKCFTLHTPNQLEMNEREKLARLNLAMADDVSKDRESAEAYLKSEGVDFKPGLDACMNMIREKQKQHDPVNRPSHYTDGKIEVIDFIEDKQFGYHLGQVVKYISRAGKKDPSKEIEDLKKARWYLDRRIENLGQ